MNYKLPRETAFRVWLICLTLLAAIAPQGLWAISPADVSPPILLEKAANGKVLSKSTAKGLAGVHLILKEKLAAPITNNVGSFSLAAVAGDALIFSHIGHETQEIAYTGQSPFDARMVVDEYQSAQVVVIGYGQLPILQREIEVGKGLLTHNPGYSSPDNKIVVEL